MKLEASKYGNFMHWLTLFQVLLRAELRFPSKRIKSGIILLIEIDFFSFLVQQVADDIELSFYVFWFVIEWIEASEDSFKDFLKCLETGKRWSY